MSFKIVLQRYSLERGEVGIDVGEPSVIEFSNPINALREMVAVIDRDLDRPVRILLEMPDGRRFPFSRAYEIITGEAAHFDRFGRISNPVWKRKKS